MRKELQERSDDHAYACDIPFADVRKTGNGESLSTPNKPSDVSCGQRLTLTLR